MIPPRGFLDPTKWRRNRRIPDKAKIIKGKIKCSIKNRVNVGLSTAKPPPHNQVTTLLPT